MLKKLFGWTKKTASSGSSETERHAIAPEMRYCPDCGDEYRAGIPRCASCDVLLISGTKRREQMGMQGPALNKRSMDITTQDQRVVLRTGKLRDLKPLRILLTKERIPTLLSGDSTGSSRG